MLKPDSVSLDLRRCSSHSQPSLGEQRVHLKGERSNGPSDRATELKQVSIYHTVSIQDVCIGMPFI